MRIVLFIFFFLALFLVSYGFYIRQEDLATGELCIGLGVTTLFFIWMPVFVYYRWKGKDVKEYMLTEENILKMRKHTNSKKR